MKQNLLLIFFFIAGMATTALIGWKTDNEKTIAKALHDRANPDSRPVMAIRKVKTKAGVAAQSFEQWATKLPANEYGKIPGAKFYIAKGERGDEAGTYLFVIEFDSKHTRDFYYPVAGADSSKISADARRLLQPWNAIASEFGKMGEVVSTGREGYTDFIILQ
jgi:hypothetical protein